ncbi:gephyrin-like molybdotransferase Glp [Vitiosangium sp. GDMCC 1.1324]|uniref:molybdopterin molybdotransferase MoeA n=1 Tax=Vitiosangium sp. (strain GDMCC 1.1324) TaxID=2138576 RepID=UPI000D37F90B|nr:gephyrin-like molybdotransferase Glp [Vitiosangium sp. GDMCC 1.1324]PTL79679.1 molybdopterin molybdenumtransferase MoeA [Vitiosangium sp. GDMCC 1.1324]
MSLAPLPTARKAALDALRPAPPLSMPLLEALGRFLARDVVASRSLPGCPVSAMDGYAVRAEDTAHAHRDRPARLRVVDTLYAGHLPSRSVQPGEASRIFTGAPLPEGANAVVRQEATSVPGEGLVDVCVCVPPGKDIRPTGEDLLTGTPLLRAGQRLEAFALSVLASMGETHVLVRPPPRIAVLATGDELVPPGAPALPHQVYESNLVLVAALAREAGAHVVALERARDDDAELRSTVRRLLGEADVLVTTGGASVGEKDRVKRVLSELGASFLVDGVALKPGKPVAVARLGSTAVVVLPGTPGAATVAFDQFARPLLLRHQGVTEERQRLRVRLDEGRHKQAGFTYLISGTLELREEGRVWARIRAQDAGQSLQNIGAEGYAVLPPGRADFASGDEVEFERFDRPRFLSVEP